MWVKYHSERWNELVSQGWVTKHVNTVTQMAWMVRSNRMN